MVFIYRVVVMLLILLINFFIIFLLNRGIIIVRIKLVIRSFFFDLEIMLNIWNFIFLLIVLIITISVLFFSFSYIRVYPVHNFIFLYIIFVLRIFWLIVNNNFYWMIFGWDGSGVVSFLLIVFYINYERVTNGLFTIFQNRIGDLFFVFFLVYLLSSVITFNSVMKYGLLILLVGACVKRAQFPFNSWLLAAIRAPTPISSLVHSSTLVVAGVYILLEFRYCLSEYLNILKFLRVLTLLVRLFGLLNERDIKKLIAYSTISHVGLILFIISLGIIKITFFHLNIHAIFKSLIFICFGFTMLNSYHRQDKRLVSYFSIRPIVKIIYYFACFCLIGLPFLRGFFSKDFIIEKAMEFSVEMRNIFMLIIFLGVRIYYRFKLLNLFKSIYVINFIETQLIGIFGLIFIMLASILVINVYISIVFSVSLELIEFKIVIYIFILCFLCLRILTNLNFKWNLYGKILNINEIWKLDWYNLDKFIFWTIMNVIEAMVRLNNVKYVLLVNWWVIVLFIILF